MTHQDKTIPTRCLAPAVAILLTLLLALALMSAKIVAEDAAGILPIWRDVFARPDTSGAAIPTPSGSPLTPEKIQLGELLFFDTRLSGDNTRSCATCHDPRRAFTDGRSHAAARDGKTLLPNTPPLRNLAWAKRFFWDGRVQSLEEQARVPIENPQEMAGHWPDITTRLEADANMKPLFKAAFPDDPEISPDNITAALATFQRQLYSPLSRFDKFMAGDGDALTPEEQSGFALFVGKAGCVTCHNGWRFTDDRLHRTGLAAAPVKTPTLRDLRLTAPYMHDGSLATLADVIDHYTALTQVNRSLSPNLVRPLALKAGEKSDLIAFLKSID